MSPRRAGETASNGAPIPVARPSISAGEIQARAIRAYSRARPRGLNGLLIWGRGGTLDTLADMHYFSRHFSPGVWVPPSPPGITGCEHACLLIGKEGTTTLICSDYISPTAVADRVIRNWNLADAVVDALREADLGSGPLGVIGSEILPFAIAAQLQALLPDIELVNADEISVALRGRLSDDEIEMMIHSGRVGSSIYDVLVRGITPGNTEGEAIGGAVAWAARIPGCAHWNFLAASGPDAGVLVAHSLPSWNPALEYAPGHVAHIDCYGLYDGYYYDLARTVVVQSTDGDGHPSIDGPRRACAAMAGALRPGVDAAHLHAIGSRTLAHAGYEPIMGTFGHGIGAGFFPPYILPGLTESSWPIEPPTALALEVLARSPTGEVAYHEDNYLLTTDGVIQLTQTALA